MTIIIVSAAITLWLFLLLILLVLTFSDTSNYKQYRDVSNLFNGLILVHLFIILFVWMWNV